MISALLDSWMNGVRCELKNLGLWSSSGRVPSSGAERAVSRAHHKNFGPVTAILLPILLCQGAAIVVLLNPHVTESVLRALPGSPSVTDSENSQSPGSISAVERANVLERIAGAFTGAASKPGTASKNEQRIEHFEAQLRLKVSQLDAVIREARALDPAIPMSSLSELQMDQTKQISEGNKAEDGIGEGDEIFTGTYFAPSRHHSSQLGSTGTGSEERLSRLNPSKLNLSEAIDHVTRELKSIPIGYPVDGKLSSGFGARVSPFSHSMKMHYGVDLSIDRETPVVATADGVVVNAGYEGGFGRIVVIDHGNGMTSLYSHLLRSTVREGERVCRGETIGHVGASGKATGPHLHYEVHIDGRPQNPARYLALASLVNLL